MKLSLIDTNRTSINPSRRDLLRMAGTVGLLSTIGFSGSAAATHKNYGNGNALGAFLNDEAAFKNPPIWDDGVADMTGQSTAHVTVGALTSIDVPDPEAPEMAPVAFDPMAVKVSPGTEVVWTWAAFPVIHHSVTSYNPGAEEPADHGQLFDEHGEANHTFSHTFDTTDIVLYFCIPHGTPYPVDFPEFPEPVENLVGMRGAVIVSDD